jgi:hypothetical protein
MATFDAEIFAQVTGQTGASFFDAVGMAYGLPSCMLNLAEDLEILNLLPGNVLYNMQDVMADARSKANNVTQQAFKWLMLNSGIMMFDTETGRFKFASDFSWFGLANDSEGFSNDLGGIISAFNWASAFAGQLYSNYQDIENQVGAITDCLDKWKTSQDFQSGNAAYERATLSETQIQVFLDNKYAAQAAKVQAAADFITRCDDAINNCGTVLNARMQNPELEPKFLNTRELDRFLVGTSYDRYAATDPGLAQDEDAVFRLVYGPPRTSKGHYLLSKDGLYYDSQTGGLDPVYLAISATVEAGDLWKYNYDPNVGGKGTAISLDSINEYTDSLFDPNLIDDNKVLQTQYDADHFLATLIQQRDKHVYDLSSNLQLYIDEYTEDSSIVANQRQLIISEIAAHNNKINRRKKQIEIAIKAPSMFGNNRNFRPLFASGQVPINDFSYLEQYNLVVDLQKQKRLIFKEGEVTGVVLPLRPSFVVAPPRPPSLGAQHLNVPEVGRGSIIYTPSGSPSGTVLSLTDMIVTDELFAIYNFLNSEVLTPSSTNYQVTNCATNDVYNNAKLVAANNRNVFFSGLSIPYLEGVVKNKSTDPAAASALGSFVRLPDTPEFRDLTYNPQGFSIEFWTHIPNITNEETGWLEEWGAGTPSPSALTKVVLACENVGNKDGASAIDHVGNLRHQDNVELDDGDQFVKGMIVGFTRDRRINTPGAAGSNVSGDNLTSSSLSFFIAPTQSLNYSSLSYINNVECQNDETFYNMRVDASSLINDKSFGDVSSGFVLVDLTVDPPKNEVRMYADGQLMATSAIDEVFGCKAHGTPQLPGFVKRNSFEYSSTTVDGPSTLYDGPKLNPFYTPWIVGGGYTDGMYKYGNFLGGTLGGITSGLRGYLGSLKFYAKALNTDEVMKNFKAQKGYFKSIDV